MKIYKCDRCGKSKEINYSEKYPKDFVLVKIFSKPQSNHKGQVGKGYHLCKKCKEEVFGK
jgi:hypothetical protein